MAKMNNLPTEILVLIFDEFTSLKDLSNCSNTCLRWKEIIETLYPGTTNISAGHCGTKNLSVLTSCSQDIRSNR